MNDFIFGTLSTAELRHKKSLAQREGIVHNHHREPRDPLPGLPMCVEFTAGPENEGNSAWLYWTVDGTEPGGRNGQMVQGFATPMGCVELTWDVELWGYIRKFRGFIPGQPEGTILRYRASLVNEKQEECYADGGAVSAVLVSNDPAPEWAQDAMLYQVFVDRFSPEEGNPWKQAQSLSGFYGGRIKGITQKLGYIQESGFNTIWISPIFPSPSHHGYDATDLFSIEPRLGSMQDFAELVEGAHQKGMRILLDFVPNHISDQHPFFQDALKNPASPYRNWFTFLSWPDEYETFFGVKELPQMNLQNAEARQYMIEAACFWLQQGVDGFRVDYAIGPAQEFWAEFRKATRKVNGNCWTFGEVVDPPDEQVAFSGLLDGCLDFLLLEAIRQTIAFEKWNAARFASFLDRHEAYFPPGFSRPSFLDNHDMNRFLWAAEGEVQKLKLAALCQFTLGGMPVVYYGTEVGLSQERDVRQGTLGIPEESRLPMIWGEKQNDDLRRYYQALAETRKELDCLRRGTRETVYCDDHLFVYQRRSATSQALILLNLGSEKQTYSLGLEGLQIRIKTGEVETFPANPSGEVVLGGWSGVIFA